jgi:hypothetical protein
LCTEGRKEKKKKKKKKEEEKKKKKKGRHLTCDVRLRLYKCIHRS